MPTTGEIVGTEKKLEENKMFKKLKDKKGFTLVELIVVLVILAILAALLVPALTGYIDKANNEKIIATTRQIVMAAQTEVSEQYGKTGGVKLDEGSNQLSETTIPKRSDVSKLAEVYDTDTTWKNGITNVEVEVADGKILSVKVEQSGKTCTYYADENDAKTAATGGKVQEGNYVVG